MSRVTRRAIFAAAAVLAAPATLRAQGQARQRRLEALHADAWYESITRDMFA